MSGGEIDRIASGLGVSSPIRRLARAGVFSARASIGLPRPENISGIRLSIRLTIPVRHSGVRRAPASRNETIGGGAREVASETTLPPFERSLPFQGALGANAIAPEHYSNPWLPRRSDLLRRIPCSDAPHATPWSAVRGSTSGTFVPACRN